MAVPDARRARAHDRRAGRRAACPRPFAITQGALDLGGSGRRHPRPQGPLRARGCTRPQQSRARAHARTARACAADTRGLDGASDHAVAYTTSAIPGWTIVIDRPRSALFADARRGFFLELALVAAAVAIVLFLIALHRCCAAAARPSGSAREPASGASSAASSAAHRSAARSPTVSSPGSPMRFRKRSASSRWRTQDHHGLTLSASAEGAFPSTAAAREIVVEQAATLAYDSRRRDRDRQGAGPARDAARRPPGAARSRALVLRDAARQPRRQPAGRALPAVRAHASARRERAGAGRLVRGAGRAGARPHHGVRARARGRGAPAAQPALGAAARRSRASS